MQDNRVLQALYSVFLGVLLALFVGVGVATFYPAPEPPRQEAVPYIETEGDKKIANEEQRVQSEEEWRNFEQQNETYSRNVSVISLVAAVVFIVLGIVLEKRIRVLSTGVMLGGIFTLIYSIGRGFAADDSKYVFIVLTISIAVVVYLGYRQFVRNQLVPKKSDQRKK